MSETNLQPELIQQMLIEIDKYEESATSTTNHIGLLSRNYCPSQVTSIIFSLSKYLNLTHSIRCLAIEIFSRFFVKYMAVLRQEAITSTNIENCVDDMRTRLHKQIILRIVSCITLAYRMASPLVQHYPRVLNRCSSYLQGIGFRNPANIIEKSEMRILNILDYKIAFPTLVTSVQLFIEVLVHNMPSLTQRMFYPLVYDVIDLWYLSRDKIRSRIMRQWDHCTQR